MAKHWASELVLKGKLRMWSVDYFRALENAERGDINEGKGLLKLRGHSMTRDTDHPLYIWCASLPGTERSSLLRLAVEYDSILEIKDPCQFAERLQKTAARSGSTLLLHMGVVRYTRGNEVSKRTLNSQPWLRSAFQKDSRYEWQREYRYVLMDVSSQPGKREFLDLELGDSSDILSVSEYET